MMILKLLKQHSNKNPIPVIELTESDEFGDTLLIEWQKDESSKSEDFIKSLSVKKRNGNRKKVKFTPRGKKQDQEDLGLQILDSVGIKVPLNARKRKNDITRLSLEL